MPQASGWVTFSTAFTAMTASAAVPPRLSTAIPAWLANGWFAATAARHPWIRAIVSAPRTPTAL